MDCLATFVTDIRIALSKGEHVVVMFLDILSAYDNNKIEFGVFESFLELSIYKMENISITYLMACNIKQEVDVKTELISNEDVTEEDESVQTPHDYEENEQSSIKLEENELLVNDAGWEQDISIGVDSWRRSRVHELIFVRMKNVSITHPTVCNIKQEQDVKTEISNEDVAEEDESVETSHDYEEKEQSSIKLEENELLVNDAGWEQDIPSVDYYRRSRMPELKLARLSQSVIDKYIRQSPATHTAAYKYLEDEGKCAEKPSVESKDIKYEIREENGVTGIEQDIKQKTAIVSEGRDHASEARPGCHKTPRRCDICSKTFRTKSHLLKHIRTHTVEKPFRCHICEKNFTHKCYLTRHQRVHSSEKPFSCDMCKKNFTNKRSLKRHIRVHTDKKLFNCDICQKNFTHNWHLKRHLRVHTGEKTFSCDFCQKSFADKSVLNRHLLVHTGKKPFSCDICKRNFTHKRNLNEHIRVHSGEKPFCCDVCKRNFSHKGNLNKHLRVHKHSRKLFVIFVK